MFFLSRISFNIELWTYTIKYEPDIKNTWFFSNISKKKSKKNAKKKILISKTQKRMSLF